jgi:hypothetical protein
MFKNVLKRFRTLKDGYKIKRTLEDESFRTVRNQTAIRFRKRTLGEWRLKELGWKTLSSLFKFVLKIKNK